MKIFDLFREWQGSWPGWHAGRVVGVAGHKFGKIDEGHIMKGLVRMMTIDSDPCQASPGISGQNVYFSPLTRHCGSSWGRPGNCVVSSVGQARV